MQGKSAQVQDDIERTEQEIAELKTAAKHKVTELKELEASRKAVEAQIQQARQRVQVRTALSMQPQKKPLKKRLLTLLLLLFLLARRPTRRSRPSIAQPPTVHVSAPPRLRRRSKRASPRATSCRPSSSSRSKVVFPVSTCVPRPSRLPPPHLVHLLTCLTHTGAPR